MSHESKLKAHQYHSRPDVLKGGLSSQEKTLAVLLEQAFRIKEDVAASLRSTQGSIQAEVHFHRLLENHILTITHIVKQLSMDIQALEKQTAQRDSVTSATTLAVQNLDQKNKVVIGDLRGRVARCDASISTLSADVSFWERQVIRLQQEVTELQSAVDARLQELEVKFYHDLGRLEASLTERSQGQRSSMSDLHRQVDLLEARISSDLKEAKEQTDTLKKQTEQQLHSSVQTHAQSSQQLRTQLHDTMLQAESRLVERLHALEARVERFETQLDKTDHHQADQADQLKRSETKLGKRISSVENSLHRELQLLKQEYHKGFLSVHDAIESLRQIGDIKSCLDKEKLQKDIRLICSKVAELNES
ncbi:protein FAM81B [Scomber japonicus]|uniref:protein FAM81B n=1 Tax=Scomber japonicus TaxID=13676 RepID=UPI0023067090|nr:protein FAM81B [Scomber japonicus]